MIPLLEMLNDARLQELAFSSQAAEQRAAWQQFRTIDRLQAALTRAKSRVCAAYQAPRPLTPAG